MPGNWETRTRSERYQRPVAQIPPPTEDAAPVVEAFPIGSVFISVVATDPATLLGYGTWVSFGAGRVLVGLDSGDTAFDTDMETGGAKTVASAGSLSGSTAAEAAHTHTYTQVLNHTHTVTVTDPGHSHAVAINTAWGGPSNKGVAGSDVDADAAFDDAAISGGTGITASTANPAGGVASGTTAAGASHLHAAGTLAFTGSATSVVQPYIVVRFWRRSA